LDSPLKIFENSKVTTLVLIFWSFLSLFLHLLYINTPFVNLEYVFAEAAKSLLDANYKVDIGHYWMNQANPLGYAWFSSLFHHALGEPYGFWSFRIPSLLGLVLILVAGSIFISQSKVGEPQNFSLWCALTIFFPLIWLFTGRATADVLPVGLLMMSFALVFLEKKKPIYWKLGSIIFSFSILVKYHALLMSFGFIFILFIQNDNRWDKELFRKCLQFFALPIVLLGGYLWVVYLRYDFFIIHANFKLVHQLQTTKAIGTFFLYASYLGIFLGPISIICIFKNRKIWQGKWLVLGMIGLGVGFWAWINPLRGYGEMNYGPFDYVLNGSLIFSVKMLGGLLFSFLAFDIVTEWRKNKNTFAGFLLATCVPYLVVCSFTRPAQRYLIFLIPLIYYYLVFFRLKGHRVWNSILGWGTVAVFIFASIFLVVNQVAQSKASDNMAKWLIEKKIIQLTDPGSIKPHSGQYFLPLMENIKVYKVSESLGKDTSLHSEEVVVFGKTLKTYFLIDIGS